MKSDQLATGYGTDQITAVAHAILEISHVQPLAMFATGPPKGGVMPEHSFLTPLPGATHMPLTTARQATFAPARDLAGAAYRAAIEFTARHFLQHASEAQPDTSAGGTRPYSQVSSDSTDTRSDKGHKARESWSDAEEPVNAVAGCRLVPGGRPYRLWRLEVAQVGHVGFV